MAEQETVGDVLSDMLSHGDMDDSVVQDFARAIHLAHTRELEALIADNAEYQRNLTLETEARAAAEQDAELWRKHKDSFAVLQAVLDAASPTILNRLKAEDAVKDAHFTEQLCQECGKPTMHAGSLCFFCTKAKKHTVEDTPGPFN